MCHWHLHLPHICNECQLCEGRDFSVLFAVVSPAPRHVMMVMVLMVIGTYTGRARRWFKEYEYD